MIKLSILWDEKRLKDLNSEELLKEMTSIYTEYQKELAATSVSGTGSIFIGLATENDIELIKNLLNLPSELRSRLLDFISINSKAAKPGTMTGIVDLQDESTVRKQSLKDLLLASPHKDIEIFIDRSTESGREIHL